MTPKRLWELIATLSLVAVVGVTAWGAYRFETWKRRSAELRRLLSAGPDAPAMRRLLQQGADIHVRTDNHETVLMVAAKWRAPELVQQALTRGLDPNVVDAEGSTALHHAIHGAGAEYVSATESPALHAVLHLLIANGADVNRSRAPSGAPLYSAAMCGQVGVIKLLHHAGARLNDREPTLGWTPLFVAGLSRKSRAVRTLLALGADPDIQAKDGRIAEEWTRRGLADFLKVLRKEGFDTKQIAQHRDEGEAALRVFAEFKRRSIGSRSD
jgi:ankyrin repeat protein